MRKQTLKFLESQHLTQSIHDIKAGKCKYAISDYCDMIEELLCIFKSNDGAKLSVIEASEKCLGLITDTKYETSVSILKESNPLEIEERKASAQFKAMILSGNEEQNRRMHLVLDLIKLRTCDDCEMCTFFLNIMSYINLKEYSLEFVITCLKIAQAYLDYRLSTEYHSSKECDN